MADWIAGLAQEDKRRSEEQQNASREVAEIRRISSSLMKELESRVQKAVDGANRMLCGGVKVYEIRHDMGMFDDNRRNDFVVMTSDYPSATMYVKLHAENRILNRMMVTCQDSNSNFLEAELTPLRVAINSNGNPVFLQNGIGLDLDDVTKQIFEPVLRSHTSMGIEEETSAAPMAVPASAKTADFTFMASSSIRKILERDYEELQGLDPDKSTKSVLVLSGGIIEGLLLDALVLNADYTFEQACNVTLKDMIYRAVRVGIITQDKLTEVLRLYRNLIHPAREVKGSLNFTASDAKLAIHAVDIIIREVRDWRSKGQPASQAAAT